MCKCDDILILDSGGGTHGTITPRAWTVLDRANMVTRLSSYQGKGQSKEYPIVNAVTKVTLDKGIRVLMLMNNLTMLSDKTEKESMCQK